MSKKGKKDPEEAGQQVLVLGKAACADCKRHLDGQAVEVTRGPRYGSRLVCLECWADTKRERGEGNPDG